LSRTALGNTQLPIQRVLGVKRGTIHPLLYTSSLRGA